MELTTDIPNIKGTREEAVSQAKTARMSSLFKNVPLLTSIKMSPRWNGKGLWVAVYEGVVIHAAALQATGRGRANVVNYFIRKAHGRQREESPQRSATSSVGGSFAWGADAQPGSDPQVREPGGRKAQIAAQNSFDCQRQRLWPRRAGSSKGVGEGRVGLVRCYLHGRGYCGSPERSAKADPGADEVRAGRRIAAG